LQPAIPRDLDGHFRLADDPEGTRGRSPCPGLAGGPDFSLDNAGKKSKYNYHY
jgi:hypothetical protein